MVKQQNTLHNDATLVCKLQKLMLSTIRIIKELLFNKCKHRS